MSVTTVAGSFITDNTIDGTKIAMSSDARGDVLIYDGTNYVRLGADNGKFLRSNGTGSNPSWETAGGSNSFTNDVTVTSGNVVIGTAGKGIDFAAATPDESGAGSMSSEILDDYEEGTWTPELSDYPTWDGTGDGQGYDTQYGSYTKIGDRCFISGYLDLNDVGTLSGSIFIIGLPFTHKSGSVSAGAIAVTKGVGLNLTAGQGLGGEIPANTAYIGLQAWDVTTGSTDMTVTQFSSSGRVWFSGHYQTA